MTPNKLPLMIAIAAAVAAPAALAQSTVPVYGKLYPYVINEDGSGATAAGPSASSLGAAGAGTDAVTRNTGMTAGNSRFGRPRARSKVSRAVINATTPTVSTYSSSLTPFSSVV